MTLPLTPPSGMRDVLPASVAASQRIARTVLGAFARYGYAQVVTPAFEHAEVLGRGLANVDRRDVLRFVEPESGEVALLRPDITPQIARIVATRMQDRPPPWRLSYHGSIIRRSRGRARKGRQLAQAGVECVGLAGREADLEVIRLATEAVAATGLEVFRVELGHVGIGRDALKSLPKAAREPAAAALRAKDGAELQRILDGCRASKKARRVLSALPELYGGGEVLAEARKLRAGLGPRLDELQAVMDSLGDLPGEVGVDLGELRGQAYYTGVSFSLLAEGPGVPLGGGGRYDELLARFDAPAPATGFALDLSNLAWALRAAGESGAAEPPRWVGVEVDPQLASALRDAGVIVAWLPRTPRSRALEFARAWGYDAVLRGGTQRRLLRARDGAARRVPEAWRDVLGELLSWTREEE